MFINSGLHIIIIEIIIEYVECDNVFIVRGCISLNRLWCLKYLIILTNNVEFKHITSLQITANLGNAIYKDNEHITF